MKTYRPTHEELKKLAFEKRGMQEAYDELEEEYHLLAEMIHARHRMGKTQADVAPNYGY